MHNWYSYYPFEIKSLKKNKEKQKTLLAYFIGKIQSLYKK